MHQDIAGLLSPPAPARRSEALATTTGNAKALAAMRRRHLERFTELEAERETSETELAALEAQQPQPASPDLLDKLPLIPGILDELPLRLRHQLYQALDLQLVYKHDTSQVAYHATITTSTPHTVNAIIHDAQHTTTSSDSDCGTRCAPMS